MKIFIVLQRQVRKADPHNQLFWLQKRFAVDFVPELAQPVSLLLEDGFQSCHKVFLEQARYALSYCRTKHEFFWDPVDTRSSRGPVEVHLRCFSCVFWRNETCAFEAMFRLEKKTRGLQTSGWKFQWKQKFAFNFSLTSWQKTTLCKDHGRKHPPQRLPMLVSAVQIGFSRRAGHFGIVVAQRCFLSWC